MSDTVRKERAKRQQTGPVSDAGGGERRTGQTEAFAADRRRLLAARDSILLWFRKHKRPLPWREISDPYRIWISEIMLQQTRVEAVKPYYFRFLERFPDIESLAAAPEEELLKYWEGLGYYSRARNLQKCAERLVQEYGGRFPQDAVEIEALPGIGSYTAGAIASNAFSLPVPAVDGNVLRVISRVLGSYDDILKQAAKRKTERLLQDILLTPPMPSPGEFNQALMECGALVCIPNGEPHCEECPFREVCAARERGLISELPVKTPKKQRKIEERTVLLLEYQGRIAIRRREAKGLLASLYEFPNLSGILSEKEAGKLWQADKILPLSEAKHIFSHVEWHMHAYYLRLKELPEDPGDLLFLSWTEVRENYPIPNAFAVYKKYLDERYGGIRFETGRIFV